MIFPSRRIGLIVGALIGLAIAAAILLGALALRAVGHEAAHRQRTDAQVAAIARRLIREAQPSRAERIRRIVDAIRFCEREPKCSRLLAQARHGIAAGRSSSSTSSPAAARRRGRAITRNARPRVTPRARTNPPRSTSPSSPPSSPPSSSPAPSPPSSPAPAPPPRPPPALSVELCTGLIDVNCPTA